MIAFKIILGIALIVSTINRPCSADPAEECKHIIFTTFEEEVGTIIVDEMRQSSTAEYGFFMFREAYNLFTVDKIKDQFFNKENSQLNNYSKVLKINLLLDYFNHVYYLRDLERLLKKEKMLVPKKWCVQTADEEISHGQYRDDGFSKKDHKKSCLFLLERLLIDVKSSDRVMFFLIFYNDWTSAMINYETIFDNQHELLTTRGTFPIGEANVEKANYYIEKYAKGYFNYISNSLLQLEGKLPVLSIHNYCAQRGHTKVCRN